MSTILLAFVALLLTSPADVVSEWAATAEYDFHDASDVEVVATRVALTMDALVERIEDNAR